jgi:hypothetical protein
MLDYLANRIGRMSDATKSLFCVQHIFGSTASLITQLAEGLSPEGVFVLGKPYSTNALVLEFLRERCGYSIHPESFRQSLDEPGDKVLSGKIRWLLDECRQWLLRNDNAPRMRAVLIDDGGKAIRLLHEPEFDDVRHHFSCVEQTRRGIMELEGVDLEVPVVNVAESWVKLQHESPLIANSVLNELFKQLQLLKSSGIHVRREAMILGYGAIGRAVAVELRRQGQWNILVYDPEQAKVRAARDDGFRTVASLREALPGSGLVVGCTGKTSLVEADYEYIRPGAVLVSASSSDIEFESWKLRQRGTALGRLVGAQAPPEEAASGVEHPCFSLYRVQWDDRHFYLANGGFPINFDGSIDPIEPGAIQLTRGLLYAGAVQASNEVEPGLHPLESHSQDLLLHHFQTLWPVVRCGGGRS